MIAGAYGPSDRKSLEKRPRIQAGYGKSPISTEELRDLSVPEAVNRISRWRPDESQWLVSARELARALANLTGAAAFAARFGRGADGRAGAVARFAANGGADGDLSLAAEDDVFEIEIDVSLEIFAAGRTAPAAAPTATAEERLEDVAEPAGV